MKLSTWIKIIATAVTALDVLKRALALLNDHDNSPKEG